MEVLRTSQNVLTSGKCSHFGSRMQNLVVLNTHTHAFPPLFLSVSFSVSTWPSAFVYLCLSNLSLSLNTPRQHHPSSPTRSPPSLLHLHLHSSSGESALMDATCLPVYLQVWSLLAEPASCDRSMSEPLTDAHMSVMTDAIWKTCSTCPLTNFIKIVCDYWELWMTSKLMEGFCVPCSLALTLSLSSTSNSTLTATELKNPKFLTNPPVLDLVPTLSF